MYLGSPTFNKGERGIPWRELRGGSATTLSWISVPHV